MCMHSTDAEFHNLIDRKSRKNRKCERSTSLVLLPGNESGSFHQRICIAQHIMCGHSGQLPVSGRYAQGRQ